ncbi:MAG: aromatic amino acid lyase, partial [Myxococcota bacterium]
MSIRNAGAADQYLTFLASNVHDAIRNERYTPGTLGAAIESADALFTDRLTPFELDEARKTATQWQKQTASALGTSVKRHLAQMVVDGVLDDFNVREADLLKQLGAGLTKTIAGCRNVSLADIRNEVSIGGRALTVNRLVALASNPKAKVKLSSDAHAALDASRGWVTDKAREGLQMYGVTVGVGDFKDFDLDQSTIAEWQKRFIVHHAFGTHENVYDDDVARYSLLARANAASGGELGVSREWVERLLDVFNAGLIPQMSREESAGSGSLQPMADLAGAIAGLEGFKLKYYDAAGVAHIDEASKVLEKHGLAPRYELGPGEALPFVSGSTPEMAAGVATVKRLGRLGDTLLAANALTHEAIMGETKSYSDETWSRLNHPEAREVAGEMRALLRGSAWATPDGREAAGQGRFRHDTTAHRSS